MELKLNVVGLVSCRHLPRQKFWQNHHATFNAPFFSCVAAVVILLVEKCHQGFGVFKIVVGAQD